MIAYLEGTIIHTERDNIVILVNQVGYEITTTPHIMATVHKGEQIVLWTEQITSETSSKLYGFKSIEERAMFRLLLSVSGIGPKAAISILGSSNLSELQHAIATSNITQLTTAPGIGKKGAERIVLDLRDKMPTKIKASIPEKELRNENSLVVQALKELGYVDREITEALQYVNLQDSVQDQVRSALKHL